MYPGTCCIFVNLHSVLVRSAINSSADLSIRATANSTSVILIFSLEAITGAEKPAPASSRICSPMGLGSGEI